MLYRLETVQLGCSFVEQDFLNLEKILGEDKIVTLQYLRGGYKEDGARLFMKRHNRKTRCSGYNFKADVYIYIYVLDIYLYLWTVVEK